VAIGGPWKGKPTIYEFYVLPHWRGRLFELFAAFLEISRATAIETQSNDVLLTILLHACAKNVASESILFHDTERTGHGPPPDAVFRQLTEKDSAHVLEHELDPQAGWGVAIGGTVVAAGDILFHYNRPYGDIYMKVSEKHRRRGLGSFLVQELKRICYEGGSIPAARCNPGNVASRNTLQRAGFVPCGHILTGSLKGE
jgi:GNAT superfamily N-acetyltransferase